MPPRGDWDRRAPEAVGIDPTASPRPSPSRRRTRSTSAARPGAGACPRVRPRALRRRRRAVRDARPADGRRRRATATSSPSGASPPRRPHVQRRQKLPVDGRRAGGRGRADRARREVWRSQAPVTVLGEIGPDAGPGGARRRRPRVDLFSGEPQPADHLGPPAPPDERLARRAVGQARLGRPAERRPGHLAHAPARRAGLGVGVQRHARQRARARAPQRVARAAPGGPARARHGPHRGQPDLALARLPDLVGPARRRRRPVGLAAGRTGAAGSG